MEFPVPRSASPPGQMFEGLAARANTDPSRAGYFAARLVRNKHVMTVYAGCMAGLIALFVLLRLFRSASARSQKSHAVLRPVLTIYRLTRRVLIRPLRFFNTNGELVLNLLWISANIVLTFVNQGGPLTATGIANRLGWLASANMCIIVFLAMKNTPLAILTQYSYERLNSLHRVAGYTLFVEMVLHAGMYADYFLKGDISQLHEHNVIAGYVLGFAVLFTVASATFLRRKNYELFYIIHVVLVIPILVTFALHQPDFTTVLPIAILTAGLWFCDRLIRTIRLLYNSINNTATVTPLPHGGTRVVLKKPLFNARAGKHCYLWVPSIRAFQTHPFTIVSNDPLELVVSSQDGFTKELHEFALANPGATIKASVEGPYGTYPDPARYDNVVLISGGSGATFTHGLATHFLDNITPDSKQQVDLVWSVRSKKHVSWFTKHLEGLHGHERSSQLNLRLHVTGSAIDDATHAAERSSEEREDVTSSSGSSVASSPIDDEEKKISSSRRQQHPVAAGRVAEKKVHSQEIDVSLARLRSGGLSSSSSSGGSSSGSSIDGNNDDKNLSSEKTVEVVDSEKRYTDATVSPSSSFAAKPEGLTSSPSGAQRGSGERLALVHGRPDISGILRDIIASQLGQIEGQKRRKVLIAACGPPAMLSTIRKTVADEGIRVDGAGQGLSVELHCEQFGW